MKPIQAALSLFLLGASAVPVMAVETARSFVQATILRTNPVKGTLTFLDASGRQRVQRATGEALQALAIVRPGDQAILSIGNDGDGVVVMKIRRSRPAEPVAQVADAALTGTPVATGVMPVSSTSSRRSWPNPYSKAARPADAR
jgi:hypothetical protein